MRPSPLHASGRSTAVRSPHYRYGKRLANPGTSARGQKKTGEGRVSPVAAVCWAGGQPGDVQPVVGGRRAIRAMTASYHHARCGNKPRDKKRRVIFLRTL